MARKKTPLPGSILWVAKQAQEAGMTYGQYVAQHALVQPSVQVHKDFASMMNEKMDAQYQAELERQRERRHRARVLRETQKEWCKILKEGRASRKLTTRQAAAALHVSQASIYNWENCKSKPKEQFLSGLARLYGLDFTKMKNLYIEAWGAEP